MLNRYITGSAKKLNNEEKIAILPTPPSCENFESKYLSTWLIIANKNGAMIAIVNQFI
jgi:hypothetical protein